VVKYLKYSPISLSADIDPFKAREVRNSPLIWKWCRQYTLISEKEQDDWIERQHSDPTIKMYSIQAGGFEGQVGVCGFTSIDRQNRNAEFSLYIAPEHQRFGYGKRALATLCRHGFEDWGFNRIWGETIERNPARDMFDKLGFKTEGRLRQSYWRKGKFIDSEIISLLFEESEL